MTSTTGKRRFITFPGASSNRPPVRAETSRARIIGRSAICGKARLALSWKQNEPGKPGAFRPFTQRHGGIGLVRQRLDGFISADAGHRGGWLETPPLIFKGSELRLNIDTGAMGTAFVEMRDAGGKPSPGFTLADCGEIGGNFIDRRDYWKGKADVSPLAGKPVRLFFRLTRVKLYAFQFRAG